VRVNPAPCSADALATPARVLRKASISMPPRCRAAPKTGRPGLRHVDNPAIVGHFGAGHAEVWA
jgi:hypothetical protein